MSRARIKQSGGSSRRRNDNRHETFWCGVAQCGVATTNCFSKINVQEIHSQRILDGWTLTTLVEILGLGGTRTREETKKAFRA